jgi:hypothetical protein
MIENLWTLGNHELEPWKSASLPDLIAPIVERYHLETQVLFRRIL